ncbi:MAG: DUF952 domain-containing protein [Hyphomonas sp.]
MTETHIYKLLTDAELEAATASGVTDVPVDREDGYVHFSTKGQVQETADKYFKGRGVVHLVRFAIADLPELKWEESRGGQLFPHLYAPLELKLADVTWRLTARPDGILIMPEDF